MNLLKAFFSACCAFFMAILVALMIEKLGGGIGSIIGTVPTIIIPSTYVILTQTTETLETRVESSLTSIIGMFSTDLLFMPTWKIIPPRLPKKWKNSTKVWVTLAFAVVFWFIGSICMVLIRQGIESLGVNIWVFSLALLLLTEACGIFLCWSLPPTPPGSNKVKWYIHMCRGIAACIAIFISGVLSQIPGLGVAAGAMTSFPGIFGTTMVSVSLAQGADVSTGAIGPLLLGGMR